MNSKEALFDAFCEAMVQFGFDRINFSVRRDLDLEEEHIGFGIISTYPEDWQAYYEEKNLAAIDPVLKCAVSNYGTFRWKDLERSSNLNRKQITFMRQAEDAGLHNGLGIPFNGPKLQIAGIGLATSQRGLLHLPKLDLINAYCNQFYAVYKRILAKPDVSKASSVILSPKEQDVLRWIASGKSDPEIARIMNISVNTVDYHIRHIFQKLEVNNRVAAAIKGMLSGEIEL
jgi:LuxR family transcriptional regulator, quorum-sensing system regulator BjaR1